MCVAVYRLNISVPNTWDEFVDVAIRLNGTGVNRDKYTPHTYTHNHTACAYSDEAHDDTGVNRDKYTTHTYTHKHIPCQFSPPGVAPVLMKLAMKR